MTISDEWRPVNVPTDTDPLPTNLLNIFGIMLLVVTIAVLLTISFRLYQKYHKDRFNYKSKSEDASDEVRFLTADEQLDFTSQTEVSYR